MFLSCGDSLIDFFTQHPANTLDTVLAGGVSNPEIRLDGHVGGSPLNVACGLACLGNSSRFFGKLSSDPFGESIKAFLRSHHVDVSLCPETEANTTLAIVQQRDDGSANYAFYARETADLSLTINELPAQLPDDVRILHAGSYSTVSGSTAVALRSLAQTYSGKCIISYDPNVRIGIEPDLDKWRECVARFLALADVVKASDEDILTLYGSGDASIEKFVVDAISAGAGLVVVTRGSHGCAGYLSSGEQLQCRADAVTVVDTVGAGDSFQAALLHWLGRHQCCDGSNLDLSRINLAECLQFATRVAAYTCAHRGAAMPRCEDL